MRVAEVRCPYTKLWRGQQEQLLEGCHKFVILTSSMSNSCMRLSPASGT